MEQNDFVLHGFIETPKGFVCIGRSYKFEPRFEEPYPYYIIRYEVGRQCFAAVKNLGNKLDKDIIFIRNNELISLVIPTVYPWSKPVVKLIEWVEPVDSYCEDAMDDFEGL